MKKLRQMFRRTLLAFVLLVFANTSFAQAPGNALDFGGVNDIVTTPSMPMTNIANFTMEVWVYPRTFSNYQNLFTYGYGDAGTGNGIGLMVNASGNLVLNIIASNVSNIVNTGATFSSTNKWYHVAVTRTGGVTRVYLNGTLAPTTSSITPSTPTAFYLGGYNGLYYFNGRMDEFRFYNTALNASQIQSDMFSFSSAVPGNLVTYYNFDQGVANLNNAGLTTVLDRTSNGNNGTVSNFTLNGSSSNWVESYAMVVPTTTAATSVTSTGFTANWTAPAVGTVDNYLLDVSTASDFSGPITGSPFSIASNTTSRAITGLASGTYYYRVRADKTSVTGQGGYSNVVSQAIAYTPPGNALNFDGSNDFVTTSSYVVPVSGDFTVELWVRSSTSVLQEFMSQGRSGDAFYIGTNNGIIRAGDKSGNTGLVFPLNQWVHLALVKSGTTATLYMNGTSSFSVSGYSISNAVGTNFQLGRQYGGITEFFNGSLDEVRVWNTARTQSQIQANMYNTVSTSSSGLVAYYNFDNGIAGGNNTGLTTLTDQISSANNGTLTNFNLTTATSNWVESYAMVVPTATAATDITNTSFTANWTAPSIGTVDNYLLDVSTNQTFSSFVSGFNGLSVSGTSRVLTGLSSGTKYYYRVRANKSSVSGQGRNSNVITTASNSSSTFTVSACGTYTWVAKGNKIYTASNNTDTVKLVNAAGGDSIVTLNLTINLITNNVTNQTTTGSYSWNGRTYTTSTVDTFSYTNANGCFSVDTLKLTISNQASCLSFDGVNDYVNVPYNAALNPAQFSVQCWVKMPNTNSYVSVLSCRDGSNANNTRGYTIYKTDQNEWSFWVGKGNNGNSWNILTASQKITPNVWTQLTATFDGTNMKLYINGVLAAQRTSTFSANTVYPLLIGTGGNELGVGNYVFYAPMSIDDVRIWNKSLTQSEISNNMNCEIAPQTNLVANYKFNQGSFNANNSGVNVLNDLSANKLNGTLMNFSLTGTTSNWSAHSISNVTSCNNYTWQGAIYTSSGVYYKLLTSSKGCDSVATLNLTVKTATTSMTNLSICPSELPYSWNGSRTAAGTYTFTTTNSQGCDSVATLNLTVKTATTSTTNVSICPSALPYSWNGSRTAAGTYTFTTTNSQGCDSVATLNLTVKANTTSTTNVSICPSALPYSWNGSRTSAGTYTFTTTNSQGCDSVATLNLTVSSTTSSTTNITNCGSYTWNGTTYSISGTYNKLFTGFGGCDSIATLNLTVITSLPAIAGANDVCAGSTLALTNSITGGVWYTQQTSQATINPSTGLVTAKNAGNIIVEYRKTGCSSVSKTITVNPIPPVPTIAYAPGTNYTLFRYNGDFCKGKSFSVVGNPAGGSWNYTNPLVGTINSAGLVSLVGVGSGAIVYTVTDAKGCKNSRTTSGNVINCPIPKGVNSNEQLATNNDFTMYPNPARSVINLNIDKLIGTGSIMVTDLYGKTVKTQPLSMGTNTVNISNLSKGMYFVSTITSDGKTTKKLVVE